MKSLPHLLLLLLVGILLALNAVPVLAHAGLVDADPAPGERISGSPDEVRLVFSESLFPGSSFAIYDTDFQSVAGVRSQIDPENPDQIFSPVPELNPGTYTVEWNAVTEDGGETSGSFSFSVREPMAPGPWLALFAAIMVVVSGLILLRIRNSSLSSFSRNSTRLALQVEEDLPDVVLLQDLALHYP
ncbi:MAG TPA: copper resistance CopC family protein [Anaerolineales bacterium]|jgi:hypothetical protein